MGQLSAEIHAILKKYWGYQSFRPLQEEIILSVLEGKDTLGLLPTGGGKSITFQVPGLWFKSGLTIVVTPLISLMKDQVDNLRHRRIKATYLHSGMTAKETRMAWENIINGHTRFLYISPEKLQNERFLGELRNLEINLITVDEAHCISQWGYDFRPSYLNIKKLRKIKPGIPVLALTATATLAVTEDIMNQLEFRNKVVFRKSFTRENLSYVVRKSDTKIHDVLHILSQTSGSSIVYVRSRKRTREIAEFLSSAGITSTFYHAGLEPTIKTERQNLWKSDAIRTMVATNAFGMGIDKADVRVVIHYDLPPSLEEYYQEAGRAGRDGKKSYAVLLISPSDKGVIKRRLTEAFPPREIIKETYEQVCNFMHISIGEGFDQVMEFDISKFCTLRKKQEKQCRSSLRLLSQAGYMQLIEETDKRSRLKVLCEREELYYLIGLPDNCERTITLTLRLYPGLFTDYVYIRESEISTHSGLTLEEIYQAFLELDRRKIVSYIPRSGLPMIYLPTSREETHTLIIGKNIYEARKNEMSRRIDSMIDYAFNDTSCRVTRMLKYFGEEASDNCGSCDVCRDARKKNSQNKLSQRNLLEKILAFLSDHPEGIRLISLENACGGNDAETARLLNYLCNEGFVECRDSLYFINSND